MKALLFFAIYLSCSTGILSGQLPRIVEVAEEIGFTETHEELEKLLPGIGALEPDIGEETQVVKGVQDFQGTNLDLRYSFQRGRLYGWSAGASGLSTEGAIKLADKLLPLLEQKFGPSVRDVGLPGESDGPRDQVFTSFSWKVNEIAVRLGLHLSGREGTVSIGSHRLSGRERLRVLSATTEVKVEVVSYHGARGVFKIEEGPTNQEEVFVLLELIRLGIIGDLSDGPPMGPDFGQEIRSSGGRNQKADTYSLHGFRLAFPVTVFRALPNGSKVATVHFGMDSLFPDGLRFQGKAVDLKRYEDWRDDVPRRPAMERE